MHVLVRRAFPLRSLALLYVVVESDVALSRQIGVVVKRIEHRLLRLPRLRLEVLYILCIDLYLDCLPRILLQQLQVLADSTRGEVKIYARPICCVARYNRRVCCCATEQLSTSWP